jgi:hypothetical protein
MEPADSLGRHLLNAIDYFHRGYPISVIYKFEEEIDQNELRAYFENLHKKFPQIGGSYEYDCKYGYLNSQSTINVTEKLIEHEPQLDAFTEQPSKLRSLIIYNKFEERKRFFLQRRETSMFKSQKSSTQVFLS